eukprot:scaffold517_cov255-Pinguiococcus_pyrenoidosus.AAC.30
MSVSEEMVMTIESDEEVEVEAPEPTGEMNAGFVFGDKEDFGAFWLQSAATSAAKVSLPP